MAPTFSVQYINPTGVNSNPAYTNAEVVSGTNKTVFIAGQNSDDSTGAIVGKGDLRAQVQQVMDNLQTTLAAVGADLQHKGCSTFCALLLP